MELDPVMNRGHKDPSEREMMARAGFVPNHAKFENQWYTDVACIEYSLKLYIHQTTLM